ncbi:thiamine diphosphokinase [Clostridium sp. SYSU_GA19001]|uniref:thiamine diphosphokinase n=1 Tax=Clostridium caldaquaticum TaxID=2940653 RepID=UPI0020775FFA|nr:thiamine diphosphokinase [Clostridium caldaquaticum]MCM8710577.1 thiamine diphosphokinase [Clostridium caldaquaticum]
MKAVIVSGGASPSMELIKNELEEPCFLICADSGANHLYKYKIVPDYLIGDFDSIDEEVFDYFAKKGCIIERYPKEKDYTDTELALLKAKELKVSKVIFLGCTGSRLDHTLSNLGLLLKCLTLKLEACIKDNNNIINMINCSTEIIGETNSNFSLLAYNEPVVDLTIYGAKYNLNSYYLKVGDGLTVSNEFLKNKVKITFKSGTLLVIRSVD